MGGPKTLKKMWLVIAAAVLIGPGVATAASITIVQQGTTTNNYPLAVANMRTTGNNALNPGNPQLVWQGTPVPGTAAGPDFPSAPKPWTWSYTFNSALAFQTIFDSPAAALPRLDTAFLDLNASFQNFTAQLQQVLCTSSFVPCALNDPRVIDPASFWLTNALQGPITITAGTTTASINPALYPLPITNLDLIALGFHDALLAGEDLVIDWNLQVTYFFDLSNYAGDCKNCYTQYVYQPTASTSGSGGYVARLRLGYTDGQVPEPSTYFMMGTGLALVAIFARRRKQQAS